MKLDEQWQIPLALVVILVNLLAIRSWIEQKKIRDHDEKVIDKRKTVNRDQRPESD